MKYDSAFACYGFAFRCMTRKHYSPGERKAITREYKAILSRAGDIGPHNILAASYALAAFFIAANRCTSLSPEENLEALRSALKSGRLVRLMLGDADSYLSPKRYQSRLLWSEKTHRRQYPNDWVVDILPAAGNYAMGYNYLECGVCKLCRDEHCPELAHYLCQLDFLLIELVGLRLERTTTLADGGDMCDFRFIRP